MMGENTIQHTLFMFLYEINQSVPKNHILTLAFIGTYILIIIFSFFVITNPEDPFLNSIITNTYAYITLLALSGVIFLQLAVAVMYKFQFQLYHQLTFFRYILFPTILIFLAKDIVLQYFSFSMVLFMFLCLVIMAMVVSFIFKCCSDLKLIQDSQKISLWLVVIDSLFVLLQISKSYRLYYYLNLLALIVINVSINIKLVKRLNINKEQKMLYFMQRIKEFLIFIIVGKLMLFQGTKQAEILMYSWPIFVSFIVYSTYISEKQTIDENVFDVSAPLCDFYSFIELINHELIKFKINQNLNFQNSLLMVFTALHEKKCKISSCLLLQKSTNQQLKDSLQPNNLKILIYKIIKKIETLFELYEQKYFGAVNLKLHLLNFYITHLPNKLKIIQLISSVENLPLTWKQRLFIFTFNRKVEKISVAEVIDVAKGQDEYQQFKKIMSITVACFREFWEEIQQQKIDINKLMSISSKLFPLKKTIETTWKMHLNEDKFTSWNILRTYINYRRNILHDYTNSVILEDYCKIIEERLKSKHEMGYINSETEQAIIAISLTESSLGNIVTLNNQTCKLFNFGNRAEMIQLRVNDIMPSVYSIVHDNILSSFLKNRYKEINQDQRFIFGKNKNGFIFPFMLQLRKLSWNANDELIFIAHLETAKMKIAPIYCITDLEGDIQDYTSTFAWLFMRKIKNKSQIKRKNIQQLVPSFFETIEDVRENQDTKKYKFNERNTLNKNSQYIQVEFSATLLYIKQQKVGYLVEGTNSQPLRTIRQKKDINTILKSYHNIKNIYINSFDYEKFSYEISNKSQSSKSTKSMEYTIPFFRTEDFANILSIGQHKTEEVFGKDIKTFRLVYGKIEHIAEQDSFHSDSENQEWKQFSVFKKIETMKEELNIEESKNIGNYYKLVVLITSGVFVILALALFGVVQIFNFNETQNHNSLITKWKIRELLPEYLIYAYYPQSINNQLQIMQTVKAQLLAQLKISTIDEWQKQSITVVLFESQISKTLSLQSNILQFNYQETNSSSSLIAIWYTITIFAGFYLFSLLVMYFYYKYTISSIYTIFLSIKEKELSRIMIQLDKLLKNLTNQVIQNSHIQLIDVQQKDNEEGEFQLMKKIKNDFTGEDIYHLFQLIIPALVLLGYVIFGSITLSQNVTNYSDYVGLWQQSSKLLPETSIVLMESLINNLKFGNIALPSSFFTIEQQYQHNIFESTFSNQELLNIFKGDPCKNINFLSTLSVNSTNFCTNNTIILDLTVSNILNYLSTTLQQQNNQANWTNLVMIQYGLMKPLINFIVKELTLSIDGSRTNLQNIILIYGIILISLIIIGTIYINCYPISKIYENLLFTKDLVSIVPSNEEVYPRQALQALTTQAIQNY